MPLAHQALFNQRFLTQRIPQQPVPEVHKRLLHDWAAVVRGGALRAQKETEVRGPFIQRFFVDILGYRPIGSGGLDWTINDEKRTGSGAADTALGFFDSQGKRVVAPVELKGADTPDLDAIMPGRHKSPVMQAWEYAMDTPECRFLLVSNMVEIRLYAVGHTRQVYERFDVLELADSDAAYWRFRLLLGADRLLTGETANLLKESGLAEKEITRKLYADYKDWRIKLLIALIQATGKPAGELIEPVQKLLDRVLFVAFAEDRGLLPPKTLAHAWHHRDPYNPRPVWENFLGLFRAIDRGNPGLGIPAYNGGLFAPDPRLDALPVPDDACRLFAALGEYDFADDVSVTVLGHIFEQSVSDLEQLKELAGGDSLTLTSLAAQAGDPRRSVSGKRKTDGIVYTPDAITRFIVDQTLGTYLAQLQDAVRAAFAQPDGDRDLWRKPTREETAAYTGKGRQAKLKNAERLVEFLFWSAWRDRLCRVRVVDPACGSGAFLVAAFDLLDAEYRRANDQIQAITGNRDLFDVDREILNANLFGVDLNPESIEITKLSLWLKTARHGKPLESLEANLRVGNSLIDDPAYTDRPFAWPEAFPAVFADGGFDVVLGNPPYVRMERLKPVKPYLERRYAVASDRADLYCYFYELGLALLRPGGRLGYISSSTFFKTGSGEPLRRHLLARARLRALIDFGDLQVFEGVTTYPAIVVLDRIPAADGDIRFLALGDALPDSLAASFEQEAGYMPQGQLDAGSWRLESTALNRLRRKLTDGHPTLKDCYGSPCRGVVTGLNEAFVVDRATRDALVAADPRSAELLKPFLEGRDLKKWRIEPQDLWLIYIPRNRIAIDDYPAIRDHLAPHREALEKRATKQAWYELQQAQEAYLPKFLSPKIFYPDISQGPKFVLDTNGMLAGNTTYFISSPDAYLLALLNSRIAWFHLCGQADALRGGVWRLRLFAENIETVPIPNASATEREALATLAEAAQRAAGERRDIENAFRRRLLTDLAPGGTSARLPARLADWTALDFRALQDEIRKQFKTTIPLDERDAWQSRFERDQARSTALSAEISHCERQIDERIHALFGLDGDEIASIEAALRQP